MILNGKKTRRTLRDIEFLKQGEEFYIGFDSAVLKKEELKHIGFNTPLSIGDTILPASDIGKHSRFNSQGKEIIRYDLPKETWEKEIYWTRYEYRGRNKRVPVGDIRYRPYKRYPRDMIQGDEFELKVAGEIIILDKKFSFDKEDKTILNALNLISEVAGEVQIFNKNLEDYEKIGRVQLNWEILPSGEYPFQKIDQVIEKKYQSTNEQIPIKQRQKFFESLKPDFIATGRAGFSGYIIYGFKKEKIAFLESIYYGNAIYVFGENWEKLSKLTKKEILDGGLHIERVIHKKDYYFEVRRILKGNQ